MMVPSRSTKTAADSALVMSTGLLETSDKFIARHSGRSEFTHHNRTPVVGDFRRFNRSRSANKSKCKKSNGSIARAGDIENLPCLGGNVMRRFVLLEEHHPVFAERDKNIFCFPFLEKRFACTPKIAILRRNSIRIATGNISGEQSFRAVWLNHCDTAPVDYVTRIRISSNDLAGGARILCDLRNHLRRQEPLSVIFKNDRVDVRNVLLDRCHDLLKLLRRWPGKLFAIDTNNLLVTRDNPRFQNCPKRLVLNRVGDVDFLSRQQFHELLPTAVFSEQSDGRDVIHKLAQVPRNVGSASRVERFFDHLYNRDRCLW